MRCVLLCARVRVWVLYSRGAMRDKAEGYGRSVCWIDGRRRAAAGEAYGAIAAHCVRGTAARAQELVLGEVGVTAKGCGALAEALGGMGRLRKLDLRCVEGQCGGGGVCGMRVMGCVEQRAARDGAWRGGERGVLVVCAGAVVAGVAACMRAV